MSRAQRLLDLIQILRRHRYPILGASLATELGISVRTLYRDIATLQAQGAHIQGEPGVGYVLKPGFILPPLMFSEEEIEAIVLGSRWVAKRADSKLQQAAENALAKISAVLPASLREQLESSALLVPPGEIIETKDEDLVLIRGAIRAEKKLNFFYTDESKRPTQRTAWPLALGFFDAVRILVAWCELRNDFRHFRVDRISELHLTEQHYPERRDTLLRKWKKINDIPD